MHVMKPMSSSRWRSWDVRVSAGVWAIWTVIESSALLGGPYYIKRGSAGRTPAIGGFAHRLGKNQ
jgi:hypothetical protein